VKGLRSQTIIHYSSFIKQKFPAFLEPKVLLPFTEVPRKAYAIQAEAIT
jgi:hypothetical protein